ncbi:MAG: LON peptidase substrate-binding domain-containing protein [Deltaproteobacteria bacterium]|nr:LON peptidase substrate-binding domain-containing protein [Deltaproteobacteria bacterium]
MADLLRGGSLIDEVAIPSAIPILPLANAVLFPGGVLPLACRGPGSIELAKDAVRDDLLIGIVAHRRADDVQVGLADLFPMGTIARITKLFRMPDDSYSVVIQGLARCRLGELVDSPRYLRARITATPDEGEPPSAEMTHHLREATLELIAQVPEIPVEASELVASIVHPGHLADLIAANLNVAIPEKFAVLNELSLQPRTLRVQALVDDALAKPIVRAAIGSVEDRPRCLRHRRLTHSVCSRCGKFTCASCVPGPNKESLCHACLELQRKPSDLKTAGFFARVWKAMRNQS